MTEFRKVFKEEGMQKETIGLYHSEQCSFSRTTILKMLTMVITIYSSGLTLKGNLDQLKTQKGQAPLCKKQLVAKESLSAKVLGEFLDED